MFSALALWALLAIFVVYPLAMLLARIVVEMANVGLDQIERLQRLAQRHHGLGPRDQVIRIIR